MRILALGILAIGTASIGPATAQTYDPAYPVCLYVYAKGANYYQCRYTSLPQCRATASGLAAECVINPYFAGAGEPRGLSAVSPWLLKNEPHRPRDHVRCSAASITSRSLPQARWPRWIEKNDPERVAFDEVLE